MAYSSRLYPVMISIVLLFFVLYMKRVDNAVSSSTNSYWSSSSFLRSSPSSSVSIYPSIVVHNIHQDNFEVRYTALYTVYKEDILRLYTVLKQWCKDRHCLSDDIEIELTYLRIRASRPATVWEISPHQGFTTMVILQALIDNNYGRLISFDIVDKVTVNIPPSYSENSRWKFMLGDFRTLFPDYSKTNSYQDKPDYVFLDSLHSHDFGVFYTNNLFPWLKGKHIYVSLHDVYNPGFWNDRDKTPRNKDYHPDWMPNEEGLTIIDWLVYQPTACGIYSVAKYHPSLEGQKIRTDIMKIRTNIYGNIQYGLRPDGTDPTLFFELYCPERY